MGKPAIGEERENSEVVIIRIGLVIARQKIGIPKQKVDGVLHKIVDVGVMLDSSLCSLQF